MVFEDKIGAAIARHVRLKKEEIEALLEQPPRPELGDLAFPCFSLAAKLKKSPVEIAKDLSKKIKSPILEEIKATGGYVNFFVKKAELAKQIIGRILKEKNTYGSSSLGKKAKVMVEYSAPNTNKPLHLGHLRVDSTGMAISNILQFSGFSVIRANLYSNRGVAIGKVMLAYKHWGRNQNPEKLKLKSDHFVGKFYTLYGKKLGKHPELEKENIELLRKWEAKDRATRELWKKLDKWAISGIKQTYKRFGSRFDVEFRESDFYDKAMSLLYQGERKKIFVRAPEGLTAQLEKYGLPNKVVLRKDGTAIYITADLSLTKYKFEKYKLNSAIWVSGSEQLLYFKQLFKILELLGFSWAKRCTHLSHGMVSLPAGVMKSRIGIVVDADDIIEKMENLAKKEIKKRYASITKEMQKRAEAIALAAIKFYLLKTDTTKDLFFDPKKAISFEGETGPYIQYAHTRAASILRKAKAAKAKPAAKNLSLLKEKTELELIKHLAELPAVVQAAAQQLKPDLVAIYAYKVAQLFSEFYHSCPVIEAAPQLREARLALVQATAQVLKNCLMLLNIEPLEKM